MATLQMIRDCDGLKATADKVAAEANFIDIDTIRRRVSTIKNRWTPEITRARAVEGMRRRHELENLLGDLLNDNSAADLC